MEPEEENLRTRMLCDPDALVKKKIVRVELDGHQMILVFGDGTFARFIAESDDGWAEIELSYRLPDEKTLAKVGLIDKMAYDLRVAEHRAKQDAEYRDRRHREYTRLRKEFEPGSPPLPEEKAN